jgi:predicted carbohydrate-binding protein with CBM5 and CBM33 domain
MKLSRKAVAGIVGAVLAPIVVLIGPAGLASAHGYVNSPASRQAQCAQHVVQNCGDIQYEPQSVEGPKGLKSCNAGVSRFAQLNDDSKGWRVSPVGKSAQFTWVFTARHRTSNYQYFIGNTKVGDFSGNNQVPSGNVSHTVNLNNYSGRQKILAVWNIADTSNAFYACIDVQVG